MAGDLSSFDCFMDTIGEPELITSLATDGFLLSFIIAIFLPTINADTTTFFIKQDACGGIYTGLKTQHQLYVGLWAFPRRAGLVIRIEIQYFNNSTLPKIMLFALAEEKQ